ncbi:MAG: SDR family NAD(P)-dependent oxidoreductase [Thermofilaceae archaeon]|nr:SDR family NAD(P)-dependent oxidoreductase [Thermofilaceae archaeon]MCX8180276.1 SDR family NAD(P)-dependent oxidoreductase [Thermofilaceae archaeon]MDW8004004.1 SDR family NAD(P)-dependent oxidoreductase [Thermofilaceae archaeon]
MNKLKAVVTGASSGIGRALSLEIVRSGGRVLGVARNEGALLSLKNDLGENFSYVAADLSKLSEIDRVVEGAKGFLGSVDVLVNNAGFGLYKSVLEHNDDELISMVTVNFIAPIALTRRMLPLMHEGSAVVNVVTAGIHLLMTKLPVYGATKIAFHYASRALAHELKQRRMRVILVYPGVVLTEFHQRAGGIAPSRGRVTAEDVAKSILKAIEKGKNVVYAPSYISFLRMLGPFLPELY